MQCRVIALLVDRRVQNKQKVFGIVGPQGTSLDEI